MKNLSKTYVICPDDNTTCGGVKQLYRHVDILRDNGVDATILHQRKGFRCTFFPNKTKITNMQQAKVKDGDILVIPEINGPHMHNIAPGLRKISFVQNAYFFFQGFPVDQKIPYAYENKDITDIFSISDDTTDHLKFIFEGLDRDIPIHRIKNSVDEEIFYYDPAQKKNQIALMPRRGSLELRETLNGLMYRNKLDGWEIKLIDKMNEAQVARVLRESKIFLPSGYLEGLPLPVMEALACGCVLIGYHGQGAKELFVNAGTINVEVGNVRQFIDCIEGLLMVNRDTPDVFADMCKTNAEFMLENYSAEDEEKSILDAWDAVLAGNKEKGE